MLRILFALHFPKPYRIPSEHAYASVCFVYAFPHRPKMPFTSVVNVFIATCCYPKGIWGLRGGGGGEASKNKLKDTSFIFPMTNVTI